MPYVQIQLASVINFSNTGLTVPMGIGSQDDPEKEM